MSQPYLHITIPGYFDREVAYVMHVLLKQNLGISNYIIERKPVTNYIFAGPNGSLEINNSFFTGEKANLYVASNLPQKRVDFSWPGLQERFTSLFGNDEIKLEGHKYYCGPDLIASTFFLLTQWESHTKENDALGRYSYGSSIIQRWELYHRPVINEYVFLLENVFRSIGISANRGPYEATFSCDIDSVQKFKSVRNLGGALYHSGLNFSKWKKEILAYKNSKSNAIQDPYFSFDYMLGALQQHNLRSVFYFMTGKTNTRYDHADYWMEEPGMQTLVKELKQRTINIGLHPSFETAYTPGTMASEKSVLEKAIGEEVTIVRQHYLRYKADDTWKMYDDLGFKIDSSVQFTEGLGFASGCCTPYSLFSISERRMTEVVEWPLILMKKKDYVKDVEKTFSAYTDIIDIAKKHQGRFQVLFHNSDVETESERALFEATLNYLTKP
ncbi:MAG: hypothetical protein KBF57_05470 [Saprospiraceae bacterium]|nr:hypothetical protein [Saprospiraceae bacterium]MBP9194112.1 hypothetical protein [Saprospiraceae bacterium]